jgi:hypothetical protein
MHPFDAIFDAIRARHSAPKKQIIELSQRNENLHPNFHAANLRRTEK